MRFSCYFEENFLENEHIVLSSVLCNEKERTINVELIGDELLSIVSFKKLLKGMDKLSNDLRKYKFDFKISYKDLKLDHTKLYTDYFFVVLTEINIDYDLLTLSNCTFNYKNGIYNVLVNEMKKISDEIILKAEKLFVKYGLNVKFVRELLNKESVNELKQEQVNMEYQQMVENINTANEVKEKQERLEQAAKNRKYIKANTEEAVSPIKDIPATQSGIDELINTVGDTSFTVDGEILLMALILLL